MKKIICDLDNTITIDSSSKNYQKKEANKNLILKLREYKSKGYEIIIYTARNMLTHHNDIAKINKFTLPIITKWLSEHDVPYDGIIVGKPFCGEKGFYIDDKAIRPSEFCNLSEDGIKALLDNEK